MSFLYLAGSAANHILASTVTGSSENTNLPWSSLTNKHQYVIGRMSTAGADDTVEFDLGSSQSATLCSIHFHNIDSARTVSVEHDDNSGFSTATEAAEFTWAEPTMYATFASASDRYWRIKIAGTNSSATYIGAVGLGVHSTLTRLSANDWELQYIMDQLRTDSYAINHSLFARRAIRMEFAHYTEAQKDEVLDMLRTCKWGQEPLIVVPDDGDDDLNALWAQVPGQWASNRSTIASGDDLWRHSLSIAEERFPVVTT